MHKHYNNNFSKTEKQVIAIEMFYADALREQFENCSVIKKKNKRTRWKRMIWKRWKPIQQMLSSHVLSYKSLLQSGVYTYKRWKTKVSATHTKLDVSNENTEEVAKAFCDINKMQFVSIYPNTLTKGTIRIRVSLFHFNNFQVWYFSSI